MQPEPRARLSSGHALVWSDGVAAVRGRPAGYGSAKRGPVKYSQSVHGKPGKHEDTQLVGEHEGGRRVTDRLKVIVFLSPTNLLFILEKTKSR